MGAQTQVVLDFALERQHIVGLEAGEKVGAVLLKDFIGVKEMFAFLKEMGGVLEGVEEELEALAGVGVLALPLEHVGEHILAVVQVLALLVLLQQNVVVG